MPQLSAHGVDGFAGIAIVIAWRERVLADADLAGVESIESVEAAEESAFAAAGWADDGGDFAFGDGQRNAAQDF